MRGNLNDNQAKIDKAVRAALERKRKIIMQSKQSERNQPKFTTAAQY